MKNIEINSQNNYKIDDDLILFKFSNLDKESVNKIKKKIFADTTVINVTHKPEDFDNIDNKLLIENGNILFQK